MAFLDVTVIITTYNQLRFTIQCFASLAQTMRGLRYEIIVVDNGSTDGTQAWVMSNTPGTVRGRAMGKYPPKKITILHNEAKRALSRSWNMGVDTALGRHILICNNDILFAPQCVQRMVALADSSEQIGIVIPSCPMALSNRNVRSIDEPAVKHPYKEADWVSACVENMAAMDEWPGNQQLRPTTHYFDESYLVQGGFAFLLTRRAWDRVGRFDEDYVFTAEDWDYFHRTRRHFKLARTDNAFIYHYEHQTIAGELSIGESTERYTLNRFLLTEKREGNYEYFSIILPSYKRYHALIDAIDSVLRQSFPHWRLYIIDDCSDDWPETSSKLWNRYAHAHSRIGFFAMPANSGPGAARNYGLRLCRGKYVAFLDSDDEWHDHHLEAHYHAHEQSDAAMVYSNASFAWKQWVQSSKQFRITEAPHPTIKYWGDYDKEELCRGNYIQTSSVTVYGDLARSIHFPEHIRMEEDWEYFKAVADAGGAGRKVLHLDQVTCRYNFVCSPTESINLMREKFPLLDAPPGFTARRGNPDDHSLVVQALRQPHSPVGVVIPTKDRPQQLSRALMSAGDVPIVVVDDASDDGDSIAAVVRRFPSATLLRYDVGSGASAARNLAARHITTEWIQMLDDDDQLVPGWQEIVVGHDADVIIGKAWVPGQSGFQASSELFTSQICLRKSALVDAGGFDESLFWAEERDLVKRMEAAGAVIKYLEMPTVTRPARGGSGNPATARRNVAAGQLRRHTGIRRDSTVGQR